MSEHHIVSPKTYLVVLASLIVLTVLTVWAGFQEFGAFNDVVALGIAFTKATLVVLFFMHVKWGTRMVKLSVFGALFWLAFLMMITWFDYWSRDWFTLGMPF